jgi:hypothetical protein
MAVAGTPRKSELQQEKNGTHGNPVQATPRASNHSVQQASSHPDPEQEKESLPAARVRTGIVSVNGRDVGEMRCTGRGHS